MVGGLRSVGEKEVGSGEWDEEGLGAIGFGWVVVETKVVGSGKEG